MLSVALCTYNGGKYIFEQLDSIAKQSLAVDEVVICDDVSTDNTIKLIQDYTITAPYNIQLFRNEINLGSTRNFEKALSLCNGDIIFLCDQDDVWLPHKVETIKNYIDNNPDKSVVFTNAFIVNEQLEIQNDLWDYMEFNENAQEQWNKGHSFEHLVEKSNCVTGATMALKKEMLNHWIHDGIIALKASINNEIGFINDKSVLYRQHSNQQLGVGKEKPIFNVISDKIKSLNWIKKDQELETQLQDSLIIQRWISINDRHADFLQQRIRHLEKRKRMSEKNLMLKFFPVMKEWISGNYKKSSYFRSSNPWIYVIKDLIGA
jgi:glycosyltransferase involved in cell wall biosynthesis